MISTSIQLFTIEDEHGNKFWKAIWDGKTEAIHMDALQAIINTGVAGNRHMASLLAKKCGYDFKP